jgi:hypothetical protein
MGLAGEPDRLSGSLFSFSLGVLGACCTGHQAKNGRAAIILTKLGRPIVLGSPTGRVVNPTFEERLFMDGSNQRLIATRSAADSRAQGQKQSVQIRSLRAYSPLYLHEELLAENYKWLSCRMMRSSESLVG